MKLILASGSPRRKELLTYITEDFEIQTLPTEEILPEGIAVEEASAYLAAKKAAAVAEINPDAVVIGADTTVLLDGVLYGKPTDAADAAAMLKAMSGKAHDVVTGVCIIANGVQETFSCATKVRFYELSDAEIEDYLATDEPYDKAGAYAIQGKGALLIEGIEGDYYNVVGLPVAMLSRKLKDIMLKEGAKINE